MLIAGGPGVARITDYTNIYDAKTFNATSAQGTTLDVLDILLLDRTNSSTLVPEDDVYALDETDPAGWPTVNLVANPSFEGTYSGGYAPSWSAYNPSTGTATPSASATAKFGGASQQLTFSNLVQGTNGGYYNLHQLIQLPLNELGTPLRALPYYFAIYYQITVAFVAAQLNVAIAWNDINGNFISQSIQTWETNPGTTPWKRAFVSGTPPANAYSCFVYVQYQATATTNSGTVLLDGAQLELATFANVNVPVSNPLNLANPYCTGTVGSNQTATGWYQDGAATGVAYNIVAAPSLGVSAQQIVCTAAAPSATTRAIGQTIGIPNGLWNYTLTFTFQVTGALSANARVRIGMNYNDINGYYAYNASYDTANGLGVQQGWQTVSLNIGPYYGVTTPNPYQIKVYAGIVDTTDASVNGTVVFGSIMATPWPGNPTTANAVAAQKYPTPYCDNTQTGCYTETGRSGLYYRQLRVFGGYIKSIDTDLATGPEPNHTLHAVEYGTLLAEAPVTLNVNAQADTAAIAAAVTYAQQLGYLVGLDTSTFVKGVGNIDAQSFAQATFRDFMDYVANQTVAAYYVDYYCRFHYGSALAQSAPFALSDTPDMSTSYPYSQLKRTLDGTQSVTEPVIEGGSQTSAPQAYSASGTNATLSAALVSGTNYSALAVNALAIAIPSGTIITVNTGGGTTQQWTTTSAVAAGATSIPVTAQNANSNYATSTPIAIATTFTVYGGNAISLVDSVTAAGVAQSVGIQSNDTLGQAGITALYNPGQGIVILQTAISAAQTIAVQYRFAAPVLVRLHNTSASAAGGSIGRKIFQHVQHSAIRSKKSGIDRANAMLRQNNKAVPVVTCTITTPPSPAASGLRAGQAILFTNRTLGYTAQLLQIQQTVVAVKGNGVIYRTLQLGFYRPDAIVLLAQSRRESATQQSQISGDTILQDVLTVGDGWAIGDRVTYTVSNVGTWNGPSTWNGSNVWT